MSEAILSVLATSLPSTAAALFLLAAHVTLAICFHELLKIENLTRLTMTLRDKAALGMSLPHRSLDALALTTIRAVARRAEELGFRDLWVTENTVDDGTCLDPVVALTFAASITQRIGVGAAVIVLPIHHPLMLAHQWATLDFVSGGRTILAVGLGRANHYRDFQVPVCFNYRTVRLARRLRSLRPLRWIPFPMPHNP